MAHATKTVTFVGGPLDGTSREIDSHLTIYKHEQPAAPEDIRMGEIPVAFFPPFHEYVYEETTAGSGTFVLKEHHHQ